MSIIILTPPPKETTQQAASIDPVDKPEEHVFETVDEAVDFLQGWAAEHNVP